MSLAFPDLADAGSYSRGFSSPLAGHGGVVRRDGHSPEPVH